MIITKTSHRYKGLKSDFITVCCVGAKFISSHTRTFLSVERRFREGDKTRGQLHLIQSKQRRQADPSGFCLGPQPGDANGELPP